MNVARSLLRLLSAPVRGVAHIISRVAPRNRKHIEIGLGFVIILIGSFIADAHIDGVPHMILDAIGYFIHGLGSAPIIESIIATLET
jgi:hypothetical protein